MEIERCLREIAAIEAELRAGNPDVQGLLPGACPTGQRNCRILKDEERGSTC